ncbi:uncharacterized protein BDW70DRAFT_156113 [Aspergillus foveolatus]|uniref:uncharacterized protein n=1 Tax=Aspergillus foveolatus TaxID=210207 RepID=UPI003CCE3C75
MCPPGGALPMVSADIYEDRQTLLLGDIITNSPCAKIVRAFKWLQECASSVVFIAFSLLFCFSSTVEECNFSASHPSDFTPGKYASLFIKRAPPVNVADGAEKAKTDLICYLEADTAEREGKRWTEDHLEKWYSSIDYYEGEKDPEGLTYTGQALAKEMKALKLPIKQGVQGLNSGCRTGLLNGTENLGRYKGSMSVQRGFVTAEDNESPKQPGSQYPPLYQLSDVYFLEWMRQANNSPRSKRLKYFLRFHIVNLNTVNIIRGATGNNVKTWPGDMFDIRTTDEGKALLRTPNGVGVAYAYPT